jgi:preprotein translocase subunit SecG
LILSILAGMNRKPTSILQGGRPAPTAPGPNAPLSPGGILNQLPAAPAAPAGPQVPQSK